MKNNKHYWILPIDPHSENWVASFLSLRRKWTEDEMIKKYLIGQTYKLLGEKLST